MPFLPHSERLRQKIELIRPEMVDATAELFTHPRFGELVSELLIRNHWLIQASVPILTVALARCRELAATDAVAAALIPYYEEHIREEQHHDEWLLEDLELLGIPRADVLRRIPSPSAAASVGGRYYWVLHHHPAAELGALFVTEGYPPNRELIDHMQTASGLPRAVFRTIELHGELDPHHRDELMEFIDSLPLEDEHFELIGLTAFHVAETSSALYREAAALLPVDGEEVAAE